MQETEQHGKRVLKTKLKYRESNKSQFLSRGYKIYVQFVAIRCLSKLFIF
jgi:hypothetical protein